MVEFVGTASLVTKPEQYMSDSVGTLPEDCAIAAGKQPARNPTVRTAIIKRMIFILTSDVSIANFKPSRNKNTFPLVKRSSGTHTSVWNVAKRGKWVKTLHINQWCTRNQRVMYPKLGEEHFLAASGVFRD